MVLSMQPQTAIDMDLCAYWLQAVSARAGSDLFEHPAGSGIFMTPHVRAYFGNAIPQQRTSATRVAVISDVDVQMWRHMHGGPPMHAFAALTSNGKENPSEWNWDLDRFFEQTIVNKQHHIPVAYHFGGDAPTTLLVLASINHASFYLQQMAGVICMDTPDGVCDQDMHIAMMRHEWAHMDVPQGMGALQTEIHCDKAALAPADADFQKAWVDARIMGSMCWPFPGRMIGLALKDPRYNNRTYLSELLALQKDWREKMVERFFQPDRLKAMGEEYRHDYHKGDVHLNEEVAQYLLQNTQTTAPDYTAYKKQFFAGNEFTCAQEAWDLWTQAYAMHLQVNAAREPAFYAGLFKLACDMRADMGPLKSAKTRMLDEFSTTLEHYVPDLTAQADKAKGFMPDLSSVMLPFGAARRIPGSFNSGPLSLLRL